MTCPVCNGRGWVRSVAAAPDGGALREADACGACARASEAEWQVQQMERTMWEEHVNKHGRGSEPSAVTIGARAGYLTLRVGRGALELMPWFRGGQGVAVLLGKGSDAGRMRVVRGDTHTLLAAPQKGVIEKLPVVQLTMDRLPHMRAGEERAAEPVAHVITGGMLEVTLPDWAGPPVPLVAPRTPFQHGTFLPLADPSPEPARVVS